MLEEQKPLTIRQSLSARRAWIEIYLGRARHRQDVWVALRKESVDRNSRYHGPTIKTRYVALRKESVDRNRYAVRYLQVIEVALRKESVDRNESGR